MRPLAAAFCSVLACAAFGQGGFSVAIGGAAKTLHGRLPRTEPGAALRPTPFPGLEEKDPRLPAPQATDERVLRILRADRISRTRDQVSMDGNVHARYRGYDLFANHIEGDLATDVFSLTGKASVVGLDAVITGDWVTVDFKDDSFRSGQANAQLRPGFLKGRVEDDVYVWGKESDGTRREIHSHDGGLTTCNLAEPHWLLDSKNLTIRPEKRLILRKVAVKALGRTLLRLPYISIPLDQRRERYTPEVGHSELEGYFVKTRWGIPVSGPQILDTYLDYYSRLGTGYGARYGYSFSNAEGYLRAFALAGQTNTLEIVSDHRQRLGPMELSLQNNYQRSNVFNAPENTSWTTRAQLLIPRGADVTRLTYARYDNEAGAFRTTNETWGLIDQRRFGLRTRTSLDLKWTRSDSRTGGGGSTERQTVDVRFRAQHDVKQAVIETEYQRAIPVGETNNFASAADRTPVISIKSDSRRLFGERSSFAIPFSTELSVGEFGLAQGGGHVTRTFFDLNVNKPDRPSERFGVAFLGRFRQGIYSDDTAQYSLQLGTTLRYRIEGDKGIRLQYSYLKPRGFTPLAIDRVGEYQLATADVSFRAAPRLSLGVQTGYDFLAGDRPGDLSNWQPVGVRIEWLPRDDFELRAWPVYDPTLGKWSNTRLDLQYQAGETFVNIGARYDGLRSTWGNVNAFVEGLRLGRFKVTAFGAYNGYIKKFETTQVSLIYDLHCWEAVLQYVDYQTGFRPGTQVYFFLRLKALPVDGPFGLGTRGQPFGTAVGRGH